MSFSFFENAKAIIRIICMWTWERSWKQDYKIHRFNYLRSLCDWVDLVNTSGQTPWMCRYYYFWRRWYKCLQRIPRSKPLLLLYFQMPNVLHPASMVDFATKDLVFVLQVTVDLPAKSCRKVTDLQLELKSNNLVRRWSCCRYLGDDLVGDYSHHLNHPDRLLLLDAHAKKRKKRRRSRRDESN